MIIAIVGPTGVGKSKLGILLAKKLHGEIINADAMQVYRGLDVGTAKVTKKEMDGVPHHLLDICDLTDSYSVYDYQRDCRMKIDEIMKRGHIPILVGGTGLYIKAALYDYQFTKEEDSVDYSMYDLETLREKIDAYHADVSYDSHNRRRMERLLYKLEHQLPIMETSQLHYNQVFFIGLTTERATLYQKIDERFDQMVPALLQEITPFFEQKLESRALQTAIGYKEFTDYFNHTKSLEEVISLCKKHSRNYAKRQYTWFKHQLPVTWFSVCYEDFQKTVWEVCQYLTKKMSSDVVSFDVPSKKV